MLEVIELSGHEMIIRESDFDFQNYVNIFVHDGDETPVDSDGTHLNAEEARALTEAFARVTARLDPSQVTETDVPLSGKHGVVRTICATSVNLAIGWASDGNESFTDSVAMSASEARELAYALLAHAAAGEEAARESEEEDQPEEDFTSRVERVLRDNGLI